MSDLLREALERIANQGTGHYERTKVGAVSDDGSGRPWKHWAEIAREALAIEPEYEYAAVTTAAGGSPIRWSTISGSYRECVEWSTEWSSYGPKWIERRVKAGPWERVE